MPRRELKVYGGNYDGRNRRIVAAHSFAEAKRLAGLQRDFNSITRNPEEVEVAMREPGAVWSKSCAIGSEWVKVAESTFRPKKKPQGCEGTVQSVYISPPGLWIDTGSESRPQFKAGQRVRIVPVEESTP